MKIESFSLVDISMGTNSESVDSWVLFEENINAPNHNKKCQGCDKEFQINKIVTMKFRSGLPTIMFDEKMVDVTGTKQFCQDCAEFVEKILEGL